MPKKPKQSKKKKLSPKNKTAKAKASDKPSTKEVPQVRVKLPSVLGIAKTSWLILWRNRKSLGFIVLIYGLVYLVLVLGLSSPANAGSVKKEFSGVFNGRLSSFYSGLGVFTYLVGSSASSASASGSVYQIFILIIASLSIIWALRQYYLGAKIRARDSYYLGLYPLIPYILVLFFIILELLPLIIGLVLYNYLIVGHVVAGFIEDALSIVLVVFLAFTSFYLISSSTIALYIVTLPNMTPLKALRSAKSLVKGRRWNVFRKIIFLPLLLFIVVGLVILPFIFVVPAIAGWLFFILSLFALVYIHSYLYSLYRGLINDQS